MEAGYVFLLLFFWITEPPKASTVPALGGTVSLCETPERLRGFQNVTRAFIHIAVTSEWLSWVNYTFKEKKKKNKELFLPNVYSAANVTTDPEDTPNRHKTPLNPRTERRPVW